MKSFLTLILLSIFPLISNAAQWAIVSTPKAPIYADQELTSPIGHIKYGKKIRVGEKKRRRNTILPIIVSGRICYIETKNLDLEEDEDVILNPFKKAPRKSRKFNYNPSEEVFKTFSEDNFISLGYQTFAFGAELQELIDLNETGENAESKAFGLEVDHRPSTTRYSWGFGVYYQRMDLSELLYTSIDLGINLSYALIKSKYFTFDLTGGPFFSGKASITLKEIETDESNSLTIYGLGAGAVLRIFPYSKYGISAGLKYRSGRITNIDEEEQKVLSSLELKAVQGVNFTLNLHYKL